MGATVYLDTPMDGQEAIEGAQARIVGEVVWIYPHDTDRKHVVPLSNVTGVESDEVDQEIEEVEYPGGRFTEVVTYME